MHLFINNTWLKTPVEQRLKDQYIKKWQSNIIESSEGQLILYNIFKTEFGPEKYLNLLPTKCRTIFIKLRTAKPHIPIEIWRWQWRYAYLLHFCDMIWYGFCTLWYAISMLCYEILKK